MELEERGELEEKMELKKTQKSAQLELEVQKTVMMSLVMQKQVMEEERMIQVEWMEEPNEEEEVI